MNDEQVSATERPAGAADGARERAGPGAAVAEASDGEEDGSVSVRQISAHEAVVKTATVEVKTLTISGKQVTLAICRAALSALAADHPPVVGAERAER